MSDIQVAVCAVWCIREIVLRSALFTTLQMAWCRPPSQSHFVIWLTCSKCDWLATGSRLRMSKSLTATWLSDNNFRKPWCVRKPWHICICSISPRVKFVCESHWLKVKVTGAKKVENSVSHNVKLIGNNSHSIKHRAMLFACSIGFSGTADQMM